jgi:hypothetical protein
LDGIQQESKEQEVFVVVYSKFGIIIIVVVIAEVVLFRLQWNYSYI